MKRLYFILLSLLLFILNPITANAASGSIKTDKTSTSTSIGESYYLTESDFPDKASYKKYKKAVNKVLAKIDDNWADEEKLIYIHDYIVTIMDYETPTGVYPAVYESLIEHKGICATYSMTFRELALRAGIETKYITCWEGEAHAWNMVKLHNKWYFIDCTWDDGNPGEYNKDYCSHVNFLLSEQSFRETGHSGKVWEDENGNNVCGTCTDTTYDDAKWRYASEQSVVCRSNEIVFFCNYDNDLYSYDCSSGKETKILHDENFALYSDVICKNDVIYLYGDKKIYFIDKNNKKKTLYKLSKAEKKHGIISNIRLSGDLLRYDIGKNEGTNTYCFNYKTSYTGYLNISDAKSLIKPAIEKGEYTFKNITYKFTGSRDYPKAKVINIIGSSARIPDSINYNGITYKVTSIADRAASGNKTLKTLTIGSSVKSIGKSAFYKCSNLKSIKVTSTNIKSIGTNAFKGIHKKPTLNVPAIKKAAYKKLWTKAGFPSKGKIKQK